LHIRTFWFFPILKNLPEHECVETEPKPIN
jgi:hypothetical protein